MPIPMSEKMKGGIYEKGKKMQLISLSIRASCLTRLHGISCLSCCHVDTCQIHIAFDKVVKRSV